jgi:hypothetical protein
LSTSQGFWSYVHADDAAEGGRITDLARHLQAQYEMLTGDALVLFLDRDALKWGDEWRNKVDESLAGIAFFIPLMTPRYFLSAECRRELQFVARVATRAGVQQLVLPLLYVDVQTLHDEASADDLVKLVRTFQRVDWRELRFADVTSERYRKAVAALAERLVDVNRQLEEMNPPTLAVSAAPIGNQAPEEEKEEGPGYLDKLASLEEAQPKLNVTLDRLKEQIGLIGELASEATTEIARGDSSRQGYGARLLATRKLAKNITEPAKTIQSLGNDYASQLYDVDQGYRTIIEMAPEEIERDNNTKGVICEFFKSVRRISDTAGASMASLKAFMSTFARLEKMSRDLRPPLRDIRRGLTTMTEATEVTNEWVSLIERAGVDCN